LTLWCLIKYEIFSVEGDVLVDSETPVVWLHQSQDPSDEFFSNQSIGVAHRGRVCVLRVWVHMCVYMSVYFRTVFRKKILYWILRKTMKKIYG
jgi:hypothetical protein